jgi:hypothetical protein
MIMDALNSSKSIVALSPEIAAFSTHAQAFV